jgi:RNase P subunit RPR2
VRAEVVPWRCEECGQEPRAPLEQLRVYWLRLLLPGDDDGYRPRDEGDRVRLVVLCERCGDAGEEALKYKSVGWASVLTEKYLGW